MSDHEITVTLKADANGCLSVIKQVTRSVDELSGKKVGNAGMPDLGKGAKQDRKSTRLNSSHRLEPRMPSSA